MTGGSAAGPRRTVLVVEDEAGIRLLCRVNLELDGFDVREAETLAGAREELAAGLVDVVLLDLHLGAEDGHPLIAECAALTPPVPVALLTGSTDLASAELTGAAAVLTKPFEIDELAAIVRSLTSSGRRGE
jgi:DNA-binding response OmpR family regulator